MPNQRHISKGEIFQTSALRLKENGAAAYSADSRKWSSNIWRSPIMANIRCYSIRRENNEITTELAVLIRFIPAIELSISRLFQITIIAKQGWKIQKQIIG